MCLYKYRVKCTTESALVETGWLNHAPTSCPNDGGHTIDAAHTSLIAERSKDDLVHLYEEFEGCSLTKKQIQVTKWGKGSDGLLNRNELGGVIELTSGPLADYDVLVNGSFFSFSVPKAGFAQARAKRDSSADSYSEMLGFISADTLDKLCVYAQASGNFWAKTKVGGSETDTDTGVALDTDWHEFAVSMQPGSVTFWIDGALVATHTTHLSTQNLAPYFYQKSTSSSSKILSVDYMELRGER